MALTRPWHTRQRNCSLGSSRTMPSSCSSCHGTSLSGRERPLRRARPRCSPAGDPASDASSAALESKYRVPAASQEASGRLASGRRRPRTPQVFPSFQARQPAPHDSSGRKSSVPSAVDREPADYKPRSWRLRTSAQVNVCRSSYARTTIRYGPVCGCCCQALLSGLRNLFTTRPLDTARSVGERLAVKMDDMRPFLPGQR